MARVDYWQNTWYNDSTSSGWVPYVSQVVALNPGDTLMRTHVDLQLQGFTSDTPDPEGFPTPYQAAQFVVALCWTTSEIPPGYFATAGFDWIFVRQISFESIYQAPTTDDIQGFAIYQNTSDSRVIDSHSARKTDPETGGSIYMVIDWNQLFPELADYTVPTVSWNARTLAKQAAT